MDIRSYERENTVRSDRQLSGNLRFFRMEEGAGKRILLVGNSITLHGPSAEIGWFGNWGMAASDEAHDYVHLLMARAPQSSFAIAQAADWERAFWKGQSIWEPYRAAAQWRPDVIVFRAGENTPETDLDKADYAQALVDFLKFFDENGTARILLTELFWPNPAKNEAIRQAANRLHAPLIPLSDLGMRDEMKAVGRFAHAGVASHPGDLGMEAIAERIWEVLKENT